jgi:hypothetical protein
MTTTMTPLTTVLDAILADAGQAPSAHNTQPWRFAVEGSTVHLLADRMRALPVNDPHDRELTISCGAALATLEIAAVGRGWEVEIDPFPRASDPDLLASVRLGGAGGAAVFPEDTALLSAVAQRHTYRRPFAEAELPGGLAHRLTAATAREGAHLLLVEGADARDDLAAVVADADRAQFGDPRWRRELAMWMHPDRRFDGMPLPRGSELGTRLAPTAPGELIEVEEPDRTLVLEAPLVVVLATKGDRPADWLRAGRALQRTLLAAAAEGVQASYLNQACQVPSARSGVRYLIGGAYHPQAILRFGVPDRPVRRTTRRPLGDLLEG